jgi:glycosyltransferase involved in cell wall biosynthesis
MIWFLVDSGGVGGIERHIATLAQSLRAHGVPCQVMLLADHGANPWLDQLRAADVTFRVLNGSFGGLLSAMRRERPKLLHTHGGKSGVLGRMAGLLAGVRVISTFHSGEREPFPVSLYSRIDEWTSFLGERIAVSDGVAARLPFCARVISNYIMTRPAPNPAPLPRSVAFVGRLSEEKCPEFFCELARRRPIEATWHVYGTGVMRSSLESCYNADVQFHGAVADLESVWPTVGLLLMPSRFEGLPLAPLEAMTHGVPVLASRVGGLPSIVLEGRTGWLFKPGSEEEAISGLMAWSRLSPEPAAVMRQACWRHVEENFSEARRFPELLAAYREAGLPTPNSATKPTN